jgi:hypothetical protein
MLDGDSLGNDVPGNVFTWARAATAFEIAAVVVAYEFQIKIGTVLNECMENVVYDKQGCISVSVGFYVVKQANPAIISALGCPVCISGSCPKHSDHGQA